MLEEVKKYDEAINAFNKISSKINTLSYDIEDLKSRLDDVGQLSTPFTPSKGDKFTNYHLNKTVENWAYCATSSDYHRRSLVVNHAKDGRFYGSDGVILIQTNTSLGDGVYQGEQRIESNITPPNFEKVLEGEWKQKEFPEVKISGYDDACINSEGVEYKIYKHQWALITMHQKPTSLSVKEDSKGLLFKYDDGSLALVHARRA